MHSNETVVQWWRGGGKGVQKEGLVLFADNRQMNNQSDSERIAKLSTWVTVTAVVSKS